MPFGPWTNSKPGCVSGASFARSKPRTDRNDWRSSFAAAAPIRPQHPVNNTRSSIFWITVAKGPKVYKGQGHYSLGVPPVIESREPRGAPKRIWKVT